MKKKLFLTFLMLTTLICLFAISVNADQADMPAYDRTYNVDDVEYPIWEQDSEGNYHPLIWYLNNENEMCKVWADNQDTTKAPYVTYACYITSDSDAEIGTIRIYDENGTEYLTREKAVIANLNGVKITYNGRTSYIQRINNNAFNKSPLIKAAFLPRSINMMGPNGNDGYKYNAFRECANLEYVEFPADSEIKTIGNAAFYRCYSLKAISLPDNVTVIEPVAFQHCTSLQAVYLPDGFQKMMCNNATSGSFHDCTSMYFVDEPFVLNSTLSNIPEKKSVYYFPSTFTGMGEGIRDCANINETLVIPNYTSHTTSTYEGSGVKTVVYLGEMTFFSMTATQSTQLNIVFANTTSIPTIKVTGDHSAGTKIYLCKLNQYYDLNSKAWVDGTTHFEEVSKAVITPSTSCTEPDTKTTFCFCGCEISNEPIDGTVSSHDYDNYVISYTNYLANGTKKATCVNCGENDELVADPLFKCLGYSAPEDGRDGIAIGYVVNNEAITEYEEATGKTLKYGVFAVAKERLGANDVFAEDGTAADGVINAEISNYGFAAFELKIIGFTDEYKDRMLAMGAYVAVTDGEATEYSYMQSGEPNENEKYCFVSYNDIVPTASTED